MAWIQGGHASKSTGGTVSVTLTVTAGHALVVSLGMYTNSALGDMLRNVVVSDSKGNPYILVCTSPVQVAGGGTASQVATFLATNIAVGATTVTVHNCDCRAGLTVDEYSAVASARAVDALAFNSTPYGAHATSVDSGTIPITGTETVYSAAFADLVGETFTPSAGYTPRQLQNGANLLSLASFDRSVTGGTADNIVGVSSAPGALHVTLVALSPNPITGKILQVAWGVWNSVTGPGLNVPFPFSNQAGRLLVATFRASDRINYQIHDSQNNAWTIMAGSQSDLGMAFCPSCKAGPNIVSFNTLGGGNDNSWTVVITEYDYQGVIFLSSNHGQSTPGASVNTGNVAVGAGSALLVSGFVGKKSGVSYVSFPAVGSSPHTWRYQFSDAGLFNGDPAAVAMADEVVSSPGNYSNTFTPNTSSDNLYAGILGFQLATPPAAPPPKPHIFSVMVPQQAEVSHLVYDIQADAWYSDKFSGSNILMHYAVPQQDPTAETFVLAGDENGNVQVETANHDDNGNPIQCVVVTREANPGGWAYAWFENPGLDLLPTAASPLSVQAVALDTLLGLPSSFQSTSRITQAIIDTGGGQPLKSMGLRLSWSQSYSGIESEPVTLYMIQWLAVAYPEPILNQRTKGTSHGLRGFQHLYHGQLAYVSPAGPVTITLNFDQPGGSGNQAVIVLPATAIVGPDPIKQEFKIPPNKWKIASYEISADTQFFLWPEDCEMWLKEWGSSGEYQVVRPWGGTEGGPIA